MSNKWKFVMTNNWKQTKRLSVDPSLVTGPGAMTSERGKASVPPFLHHFSIRVHPDSYDASHSPFGDLGINFRFPSRTGPRTNIKS